MARMNWDLYHCLDDIDDNVIDDRDVADEDDAVVTLAMPVFDEDDVGNGLVVGVTADLDECGGVDGAADDDDDDVDIGDRFG